jgi:hypothetical protein
MAHAIQPFATFERGGTLWAATTDLAPWLRRERSTTIGRVRI